MLAKISVVDPGTAQEQPAGFAGSLAQGDDWSFIIKLSALIEAALTKGLAVKFNADSTLCATECRRANGEDPERAYVEVTGDPPAPIQSGFLWSEQE